MLSQSIVDVAGGQPYGSAGLTLLAPALGRLLGDASNALDRDNQAVRSCLEQALALLQTDYPNAETNPPARGGLAAWQERRVRDHIEGHLDEPIRVVSLAEASRLGVSAFSAAFRQTFGSSLQTFLAHRRVERAKTLMSTTHETLADIALSCGFCDQAHLCRRFRAIVGSTPNAWRREHLRPPLTN